MKCAAASMVGLALAICSCSAASRGVGVVTAPVRAGVSGLTDRLTPVDTHLWRPGVTTQAQIVDALGPPATQSFLSNGDILLVWKSNVGVRSSGALSYGFVIAPDGRLARRARPDEVHAPPL